MKIRHQRVVQRVQLLRPVQRQHADPRLRPLQQHQRLAHAHPFTAPAVSPATNWRCRKKNTATTGSEIITDDAISSP